MSRERLGSETITLRRKIFHLEHGQFTIYFPSLLTVSQNQIKIETNEYLPRDFIKSSTLYSLKDVYLMPGASQKKTEGIALDRRLTKIIYVDRVFTEARRYLVELAERREGKKMSKNPTNTWIRTVLHRIPLIIDTDKQSDIDFSDEEDEFGKGIGEIKDSGMAVKIVSSPSIDEQALGHQATSLAQWLITDLIIEKAVQTHFSLNQAAFKKLMIDYQREFTVLRILAIITGFNFHRELIFSLAVTEPFIRQEIISRSQDKFDQIKDNLWNTFQKHGPLVKLEEY